jgi:magnesium transporter
MGASGAVVSLPAFLLQCDHMATYECFRPSSGSVITVEPAQVPELLQDGACLLWIDLPHPSAEEQHWVEATFPFHPLALEDMRKGEQRSKLDQYADYAYFVARVLHQHPRSLEVDSDELDIFIGRNYLVTIHHQPLPALTQARERWRHTHTAYASIPFMLYLVLDTVVDGYFPIVDTLGEHIDDLDTAVLASQATLHPIDQIFRLRRSLLHIRKILGPLRDALNELLRVGIDEATAPIAHAREYYLDVFDHVLRLTDFVDTYRDMLSTSLDLFQSVQANRLNLNMQRLTVAATVMATATVITGFYGMNLQGLFINSSWPYGGQLILGLLLLITAVEIWVFRRRGWL